MTLTDPAEIDALIERSRKCTRRNAERRSNRDCDLERDARRTVSGKAAPGRAAWRYVRLAITDDGPGMPSEVLDKALEPFFTTKGPGAGTGLGLTSVASFARQSGGFSTIANAPGQGCIVSLYLPRFIEEAPAHVLPANESPLGDGELVLVVEDDDQVREVTLRRIEFLGYAVAEARTGPEAIDRLQSLDRIQLVLSDIVMPGGLTGYDVARWVASNRPAIKVILCSGYNEGDRGANDQGPPADVHTLGKPYSRDQLAKALSKALVQPEASSHSLRPTLSSELASDKLY